MKSCKPEDLDRFLLRRAKSHALADNRFQAHHLHVRAEAIHNNTADQYADIASIASTTVPY